MKRKRRNTAQTAIAAILMLGMLAACGGEKPEETIPPTQAPSASQPSIITPTKPAGGNSAAPAMPTKPQTSPSSSPDSKQVAAKPDDTAVLVNKMIALPDRYEPADLVEADVPFIFKEKNEKRKLRNAAAEALKDMFEAAKKDGIEFAGVSGYRSQAAQETLYQSYVKKDGAAAADKYSAKPGHSEHQTGLAIDVSGIDGKCAASDCFAGTKEAVWLEKHAHEFGFIIRYPKGKEEITGYQYEPWHVRYVGRNTAKEIRDKGQTLEEYWNQAVPVSG